MKAETEQNGHRPCTLVRDINVSGWKANLEGAENPLQMCVSIGDDFGCAERKGRIR